MIHILSTKVNAYQFLDQDSSIHVNDEWRQNPMDQGKLE